MFDVRKNEGACPPCSPPPRGYMPGMRIHVGTQNGSTLNFFFYTVEGGEKSVANESLNC